MKMLKVAVNGADTITAFDDIVEFEATGQVISDSAAKAIASWYVSGPIMTAFSRGQSVCGVALRYELGDAQHDFRVQPDPYASGDLLCLDALLSWINSRLLPVRDALGVLVR